MSRGRVRDGNKTRMDGDIVEVADRFRGLVIGKEGRTVRRIKEESGADVRKHPNGFLVRGPDHSRRSAKQRILEVVEQAARQSELRDDAELLDIPEEYKGQVIGRGKKNLNEISRTTGAHLFIKERNVYAAGPEETKEKARREVGRIVMELKNPTANDRRDPAEMLDIPEEFKGFVIGPNRQNLGEISTRTGAHLFVRDRNVYVSGSAEAREKARSEVQFRLSWARSLDTDHPQRSCCLVDDVGLPEKCELRLVPAPDISTSGGSSVQKRYRLRLEDSPGNSETESTSSKSPRYKKDLMEQVNQSLVELKESIDSGHVCRNDMWFHFGTVVIWNIDEADAGESWTLDEVVHNLSQSRPGERCPLWRTNLSGKLIAFDLGALLDQPAVYDVRHDVNVVTPSGKTVRCKMWVRREDHTGTGGDGDEIPFDDVKNVVSVVEFKNKNTKARCRGWLCLPSTKKLKADIIFPTCDFDCRLTLRTSHLLAKDQEEEEDKILLDYLSYLELDDGDDLVLPADKLPTGFRNIYQRRSKRTSYDHGDFTIIISKESWLPSGEEKTDLHLHCKKWDKLLRSGQWEPQEIMDEFPSFLDFVDNVKEMLLSGSK